MLKILALLVTCIIMTPIIQAAGSSNLHDMQLQFPLLSATAKRNAEFTIQLSYNPLGRAR
jgi:hypothetical protein